VQARGGQPGAATAALLIAPQNKNGIEQIRKIRNVTLGVFCDRGINNQIKK
jgi:hypothetical protein